jgi:hypothetical protein
VTTSVVMTGVSTNLLSTCMLLVPDMYSLYRLFFKGRAFPELQMMTPVIYGLPSTPATLADEKGNAITVSHARDGPWLERLLRPVCEAMGCSAGFSSRPLTGRQVRTVDVDGERVQACITGWRVLGLISGEAWSRHSL